MKLDLEIFEVYEQFYLGELDKESAFEKIKSYIESDIADDLRVKCVNYIGKLGLENDVCYKFLENLLISDSSEGVRFESVKIILRDFLNRGMDAIKWSLEHDLSPNSVYFIIKDLRVHEEIDMRLILYEVFQNLIRNKYKGSEHTNVKFYISENFKNSTFTTYKNQIFYKLR